MIKGKSQQATYDTRAVSTDIFMLVSPIHKSVVLAMTYRNTIVSRTFHLGDTNNTSVKGYLRIDRTPPRGIGKDVGSIKKR